MLIYELSRNLLNCCAVYAITSCGSGFAHSKHMYKMSVDNVNKGDLRLVSEEFKSAMAAFESRLNDAIDVSSDRPTTLEALAEDFKAFQSQMLVRLDKLNQQVMLNTRKIDELECYSRRNCLVFHGIPESANESLAELEDKVLDTVAKLNIPGFTLSSSMIDRCHRLGKRAGTKDREKGRSVIVRFTSHRYRCRIWFNKKYFKGTKISVSESLSGTRLALYHEIKELVGKDNVWTSDARICFKLSGVTHRIQHPNELQNLRSRLVVAGSETGGDDVIGVVERVTRAKSRKGSTAI